MAYINRVIIMGRLGKDPELRYTQNQTPVCTLNVATKDYRKNQSGERQEFTEWHRVVVWSQLAENATKYLNKGRGLFVEGRLQTRSWEDQNGQKRYSTEIVANNIQYLPQANVSHQSNNNNDGSYGNNQQSSYSSDTDNGGGFPMGASQRPSSPPATPNTPNHPTPTPQPQTNETEKLPVINQDESGDDMITPDQSSSSQASVTDNLPF